MEPWTASYGLWHPAGVGVLPDAGRVQTPPQRFREFLAAELDALEERLSARFELGEPGPQRRSSRRESASSPLSRAPGPSMGSAESGVLRRRSVDSVSHRRPSYEHRRAPMSCEEEVPSTKSDWERMAIRLLAAEDPSRFGIPDLVLRITRWRLQEQEQADSAQARVAEEPVPEELVTPHPMWMSHDMMSKAWNRTSYKSTFALSRVGEEGPWAMSEEDRPRAGGVSKWIVVHPESIFRYTWTLIGVMFLMYDLFTIPMQAVKLWDGSSSRLMEVTIGYWSADLLCQGLMGYHTQNHIEMRPLRTLRHYATTWMPLDVTVLLLDIAFYVLHFNSSARSSRILKLFRLVRLTRLHKWVLAVRSIMKSNTSELADLLVEVGRLIFVLLCLCHFTACAWYGIAEAFADAERPPGRKANWIEENALSAQSNFFCYAVALHWSVTQFTPATNNVVPVNGAERTFAIAVVLLGFVAFSAFLSSMVGTLGQLKSLKQSQVRERQQLLQFFRNKRLPAYLADRVLLLYDAEGELKRDSRVEGDFPAISYLPISLRLRIRREYCAPLLKTNTILGGVYRIDRRCFLQIMFEGMVDTRYCAEQEVFVDGLESNSMYAVSSGKLKYCQRGATTWLKYGEWVSEASLYVQWVHQGSLVAKTRSVVLQLECDVCRKVVLQTGGELFRMLRCCAVLFAHKLEVYAEELSGCLSDLGISPQDQLNILWRSQKICRVRNDNSSTPEDRALTPLRPPGARASLTRMMSTTTLGSISSDAEDQTA